jgi:hypothetical protein
MVETSPPRAAVASTAALDDAGARASLPVQEGDREVEANMTMSMADGRAPARVAINVMRARLTVVGFNLAIMTFQLSALRRLPGSVTLPNSEIPVQIHSDASLLMGVALSVLAMVGFIASSAFDDEGMCTHWSLLAGDLFMYLGLAHSVAGTFSPLTELLQRAHSNLPDQMAELEVVRTAVVMGGGLAWFGTAYVGPAVSLIRSPFGWRITTMLGLAYLSLLLALAHVDAQAVRLDAARAGIETSPPATLLGELVQPLRW